MTNKIYKILISLSLVFLFFALWQYKPKDYSDVSQDKKSADLAENSEIAERQLSLNNSDFIFADNGQLTQKFRFFEVGQKSQSNVNHLVFGHIFNQKNGNAGAPGNIETKNIAESPVKSKYNPFGFNGEVKNFFVAGAGQAGFFNRDYVKTSFFDGQNNIFMDALVGKDFEHKEDNLFGALQFKNFLFGESSGRVAQSHSDILGGDIGILFRNLFNRIAGLNQIQNIGNRDSGSLNAGLAESNLLFYDNASALVGFNSSFSHINNYTADKNNVKFSASDQRSNQRPISGNLTSVVHLPKHLAFLESVKHQVSNMSNIIRKII